MEGAYSAGSVAPVVLSSVLSFVPQECRGGVDLNVIQTHSDRAGTPPKLCGLDLALTFQTQPLQAHI